MCGPILSWTPSPPSPPQVQYKPSEVTYEELLAVFFDRIDPTQVDGQGGDWGTQYRTGVYYHTEEQEAAVSRWGRKPGATAGCRRIRSSRAPRPPNHRVEIGRCRGSLRSRI